VLAASPAVDGERFERGHIYVAPPDHHLLLRDGVIELSAGPRENGHRPAVDPLFKSAARAFGARVIAVVLSGALDDGAAGARFVKERGGATVVQDPDDALYPAMPVNTIAASEVDAVVPVERMPAVLADLLGEPLDKSLEAEAESLWSAEDLEERGVGEPSGLTCPECGGSLSQRDEGKLVRFACRTGHAYSPQSLMREQSYSLEQALWSALRGLEERADLFRRMARRTGPGSTTGERLEARAAAVERHAGVIRETMARLGRSIVSDPNAETPT
jgi:two-component system chemotaxis response regulator CheB